MKTTEEIRRHNLLLLIEQAGGVPTLAEMYGCTEAAIKTMARAYKDSKSGNPKGIGSSAARKLESVMNKERGWLDNDHELLEGEKQTVPNVHEPSNVYAIPFRIRPVVDKITRLVEAMSDTGHAVLLYEAEKIAKQYPRAKANPAN